MLHRRRRSGPASTSTLDIAPSLAPVQTPVFALVLTNPLSSKIARRSTAEGYLYGGAERQEHARPVHAFAMSAAGVASTPLVAVKTPSDPNRPPSDPVACRRGARWARN